MRNVHTLKLDISYCDDVVCRRKLFEIRKNDRDYKVGDLIKFKPVQNGSFVKHEIEAFTYSIMYILDDNFIDLKDGYIAFTIAEHWIDIN